MNMNSVAAPAVGQQSALDISQLAELLANRGASLPATAEQPTS